MFRIVIRLWLLICASGALATIAPGAAASPPTAIKARSELAGPRIVLIWASWCVPCRTEMKRFPALAEAARPMPVAVLALDPPAIAERALDGKLPGMTIFADARPPAVVLAEWGGAGAAMPLAVALDRSGKQCGIKRGLLGTDQLHAWAQTCLR